MQDFFDIADLETLGYGSISLIEFEIDWRFANERKNCPTLDSQEK